MLHEFDQDKRSKDLRKNECRDCIRSKNKTRGNKEDKEGYPLRFQCIQCKRFHTAVPFDDNEIQWLANHLSEERSETCIWLSDETDQQVIDGMQNNLEILDAILNVLEAGKRLRK